MTNTERTGGAVHLIIRGDGEDLARLDPDPHRFLTPVRTPTRIAWGIVVAVVLTAVSVPCAVWVVLNVIASTEGRSAVPELVTGLSIPLMVPAVGLTLFAWADVLIGVVGRAGRVEARDAYLALAASLPRPRLGVVRRCDYRSGETRSAFDVTAVVELDDGTTLRATERKPVPLRAADGTSFAYTAHQVPQHGDLVTVFRAPAASGLTIVQANHSWSRLQAG